MKILIIEDKQQLLESILEYFKSENYICDITSNFNAAVWLI